MKAPHDIKTDKTLILAGSKVKACTLRFADGSVQVCIKGKKETVFLNFDSISEMEQAGWK